jgi:hypothetical protein
MSAEHPDATDPDGRRVVFDARSRLHLSVRGALERDEELKLTWPPAHLEASALRRALAA